MGTLIVIAVVMTALGYFIGNSKGRATEGVLLGFFLGLIGVIIIACLKPKHEPDSGHYFPPSAYLPTAQPAFQPPSQWVQDPYGRHEYRWWDGRGWSDQVSDGGVQTADVMSPLALPRPY